MMTERLFPLNIKKKFLNEQEAFAFKKANNNKLLDFSDYRSLTQIRFKVLYKLTPLVEFRNI